MYKTSTYAGIVAATASPQFAMEARSLMHSYPQSLLIVTFQYFIVAFRNFSQFHILVCAVAYTFHIISLALRLFAFYIPSSVSYLNPWHRT